MVSILNAVRDIARVREVSTVLVKHGFGEVVGRLGLGLGAKQKDSARDQKVASSLPLRLRRVLEDLGPSFVKLGQLASTRSDLLPADLISELQKLQDSAPPIPIEDVRSQIELSLGMPAEEIFEFFDDEPLAAASIAQVHRARLKTTQGAVEVAVKVQRPKIATTIASDVEILHALAALLERAIPETRIYSPIGLIQQFDQAITAELDFVSEADNARRFKENFEGDPRVRFPNIHRQVSSKQVLTMEFLEGVKINQAVAKGFSGKALSRLAFSAMIKQIYEDGFFHADPHPGNVLVSGEPDAPIVSFVDLGMVGRLSPRMRDLTIDVVMASLRRDYEAIADTLYAIGTPTKKINMEAYKAEVALLSEKYLGKQLRDIEMSAMIRDLVRGGTKFGIEIPTDFVMMGKSLMTIEGIGKEIDPDFDVYEEARPLFSELLRKRYSPERVGNELLRRIERLGGAGYKVPQQVEEVLDDLRFGRLTIKSEDPSQTLATDRLGGRLMTGALASALIVGGALLVSNNKNTVGFTLLGLAGGILFLHAVQRLWHMIRSN
jgi:ubiquinone biosynthesis protein